MKLVVFVVLSGVLLTSSSGVMQTLAQQSLPSPSPQSSSAALEKTVESEPSTANTDEEFKPPPFQPLRYNENYRYLADKSKRRERLDRLKYIPLRRGKENWYLSIGGEARFYYEQVTNPGFGSLPTNDGYFLQRYLLHTDWRFGKRARFFFQIRSAIVNGREGGARPAIDKNDLDIGQAFFDYKFSFKSEGKTEENSSLTIRVGRHEMAFGAQRLVSVREGANVRRSFDGVRLTANVGKWRVDGFAVKETQSRTGLFDDRPTPGSAFWGVYATRQTTAPLKFLGEKLVFDLYYFGIDLKTVVFNSGAGRDRRHSFGARIANTRGQGFDFDYEFVGQTGNFRGSGARAWGFGTETGYTFDKVRFKPRFAVRLDGASGDRNPRDNRLNSFQQLYPEGYFFGRLGAIGFVNLYDIHPLLTAQITKKLAVNAESLFFFRQNVNDTVYNLAGFPVRSLGTSRARYTGNQLNFSAAYNFDRHTTLTAYYSRFNVGGFLKETPPSRNTDYYALFLSYKF